MSVYVGIDVHRKRSQVAVVTEDGQVQLNKNVVNGSDPMLGLIGDLPPGTPVASGAAFGWGWLAQLLEDYGFEAHLVHPLRCKAIASARLKNDKGRRRDPGPAAASGPAARSVDRPAAGAAAPRAAAAPGRAGPAAHPAAEPDPRGGRRFRLRPGRQLPVRARPRLAGRAGPAPVSREIVTDCLAVTGGLAPVIDRIDGELRQHAKAEPRARTLTTVPGVGQFTALVMLAEIGDITRFGSARKLASWSGLTPAVRGSDLTVRHGHITRARLGLAAVGHEPGRPDRQALPRILRHLRRHRQTPREEDRHHRDLPQAADPRLAPARHRPRTRAGRTGCQHGHRSTPPDREGHQAPGELALAA